MNLQIYFRGVHRDSPIFVASFCRTLLRQCIGHVVLICKTKQNVYQ